VGGLQAEAPGDDRADAEDSVMGETVMSGAVVAGLMVFAFLAGFRIAYAILVESKKLHKTVATVQSNDVRQDLRLSEVESKVLRMLRDKRVKRVTIKKRSK
jgi:hypothetical protein